VDEGITVTGVGTATAAPNTFRLDLGAQVTSETATGALRGAGDALDQMRKVLLDGGVGREDVASTGINLWPQHSPDAHAITGYTAMLGLTVRIRDVERVGVLLAETVAAGGDASRLEGANFEYDDPSALLSGAREAAWRDAEAKASQYARLAGRSLGAVVGVSERAADGGPAPLPRVKLVAAAADAVPVEPGTTAVTVHVDVRWTLG
jgi:uncharacterized protein